jgi:hypothetical protein
MHTFKNDFGSQVFQVTEPHRFQNIFEAKYSK